MTSAGLLFLGLGRGGLAVFYGALEVLDAFAKAFAKLRDL
jgi:hypothetical protein